MDWNTTWDFIIQNLNVILGVALFFAVMYSIYLKIALNEERELIQELNQKFTDHRIELFENFIELFKSFVVESQGQKKHELSEELDQAIREFIVDSSLLNADKNNTLLKQWKKLLNDPNPIPTRKMLNLFLLSIKNMREELGINSKSFKVEQYIPLIHSDYSEEDFEDETDEESD